MRKFVLGLLVWFGLGPVVLAQSDFDSQREFEIQQSIMDLNKFRKGSELGERDGAFFFRSQFIADCAYLSLNQTVVTDWLNYADQAMNLTVRNNHFDAGYVTGWVIGFMNSYEPLSVSCSKDFSASQKEALQQKTAECQKLAAEAKNDLVYDNLFSQLPSQALRQSDVEDLIGLVYFGKPSAAWERMKALDKEYIFGVPCAAIMVKSMQEMLKEKVGSL